MQTATQQQTQTENKNLDLKGINDAQLIEFLNSKLYGTHISRKIILSVDNAFSIQNLPQASEKQKLYTSVINLRKLNDIKDITKFFASVNSKIETDGRFICCVETAATRKQRLYKKFPPVINTCYYFMDFMAKRVASKVPVIKKGYFFLTAGRNRVLTEVEILGRLVYCGFKIVGTRQIKNMVYIVADKEVSKLNVASKNYGVLFRMRRYGYKAKPITVYKFRTMHAYSEYLQEYVYEKNKLAEGGKFKNDFRVNLMGKIIRKLWIDELPMLYNWFRRDIKLVGVRPLSEHYLSLYDDELVKRRWNFKPGLIPPFYADMPKTLNEIMDSERRYFDAYEKNPIRTDFVYFFRAINNILIKKARSK